MRKTEKILVFRVNQTASEVYKEFKPLYDEKYRITKIEEAYKKVNMRLSKLDEESTKYVGNYIKKVFIAKKETLVQDIFKDLMEYTSNGYEIASMDVILENINIVLVKELFKQEKLLIELPYSLKTKRYEELKMKYKNMGYELITTTQEESYDVIWFKLINDD
ncbi:MAG: hypothetical protein RR751_06535 [Clostridia bacterium]